MLPTCCTYGTKRIRKTLVSHTARWAKGRSIGGCPLPIAYCLLPIVCCLFARKSSNVLSLVFRPIFSPYDFIVTKTASSPKNRLS